MTLRDLTIPTQVPLSLVGAGTVLTSDPGGGIEPGTSHGLYHRDVRVLSRATLTVDDIAPTVLRSARRGASRLDTAMATSFDVHGDARAVLVRHRSVDGSVVDRYELHRLVAGPPLELRLDLAGDLATVFEVKHGVDLPVEQHLDVEVVPDRPHVASEVVARLRLAPGPAGVGLRVEVVGDRPRIDGGQLVWEPDPLPGQRWELELRLHIDLAPAAAPGDEPGLGPAVAADAPLDAPPTLSVTGSDHRWQRAVHGAAADLSSLRMSVGPDRFTAAGAPWFMALFGRDALLTSHAALPLGTDAVLDTLDALARHQGIRHDQRSCEQPGRILHELRTGAAGVFGLEPGAPYFGTADATPLFVVVLADAARFGADEDRIRSLLPAARAAVAWCIDHGDIDGDGFVEAVADPGGIENQGWKDSGDAMVHADGSQAPRPIALVEVQGYVFAALRGLADLETRFGDPAAADGLRARAERLATSFLDVFWSSSVGGLAMGLDADKRPLEVASSNMGHALWSGILDPAHAAAVAQRVAASDLLAGWGIRTLGSGEVAYSPLAYHRGSIWPHDTAIVAHGMSRAGAIGPLSQVIDQLLDVSERFDHRLPELLGGIARDDMPVPVPYPVACSPQAWSAAAPLLLLRAVLGLEPDVPAGVLRLAPSLPVDQVIEVRGLRLGARSVDITVDHGHVTVDGADDLDLEVVVR